MQAGLPKRINPKVRVHGSRRRRKRRALRLALGVGLFVGLMLGLVLWLFNRTSSPG